MNKKNIQPITGCGEEDIAPYVFLCGDPERVPQISAHWTDVNEVCCIREYVIHTGMVGHFPMTVASTGIGGPSTAIAVEELAKLGAHTMIRVGNSGALAEKVRLGDFVITTGSIRDEGTSRSYVRSDYPAVGHYDVVRALVDASEERGHPFHTGVTWSIDAFYARNKVLAPNGELASMSVGEFEQSWMNDCVVDCEKAGVLNVEMESAAILTLAGLFGLRAGCICTVSDRTPWPGPGQDSILLNKNMDGMIVVALEAMKRLAVAAPEP